MSFTACSVCVIFKCQKKKSIFIPSKLGSTKWFKFGFCANISGSHKYLIQVIVLLKPDFNCVHTFTLSLVDEAATGT